MTVNESIPPAGQTAAVRFTGANDRFRRLVTRGALLELVTFGFYRFWLATDIRRYLWSGTEIDGDALEYTGRGKELLLGFLFAMAVLAPIFLIYFLVGLAFERFKAFASLPLYAFFFLFGQFAVYRARRYRLTRTIWRGVRFWMTGSGWSYAVRALLWGLLLIPTLGFAYPWQMAALERYKLGHTFYGDQPGRFEGRGSRLFKRVWWIWLLGLCPVIVILLGTVMSIGAQKAGRPPGDPLKILGGLIMVLGYLLCIALPFLHAARKAVEWRWWAEGIRFGGAGVACTLPRGGLIGIYWSLIGVGLLVMVGFLILGGGIAGLTYFSLGRMGVAAAMRQSPAWAFVAYGAWYLSMVLALGVVARIYTLQRIWQRVAGACLLRDPASLANVKAAGEAASAFGEGLADGLDFAGF